MKPADKSAIELEHEREALARSLKTLPLTDRRRGDLARRLVAIEDEIERRGK